MRGFWTKKNLEHTKKSYDDELLEKEAAIRRQKEDILNLAATVEQQQEWMKHILVYKDIDEVDRTVIVMLVKRIRVSADKRITLEFGTKMNMSG